MAMFSVREIGARAIRCYATGVRAFGYRGVLLAALLLVIPTAASRFVQAQLPGQCCQTCRQQIGACSCTTMHPVVRTRYRQEKVVSYHNQRKIAFRQEAYCETVPTTQVQNICVDEGHYKMVWVPKPVTKQICKTVMQQRTAYRTVPYAYNECVPRVCTQVVPEQYVTHVPITTTTQVFADVTTCSGPAYPPLVSEPSCCAPGYGTAGAHLPQPLTATAPFMTGQTHAAAAPAWQSAPQQYAAAPHHAAPHLPTPAPPRTSPVVPHPRHMSPPVGQVPGWQQVRPRTSAATGTPTSYQHMQRRPAHPHQQQQQHYTRGPQLPVQNLQARNLAAQQVPARRVPSAAQVWQNRR